MRTPDAGTVSELSDREREILRLVATGASNKEIARQLYISTNTVKVHLRNIFAKIGAASRTEAAFRAVSEGLVVIESPVERGAPQENDLGSHRVDAAANVPGARAAGHASPDSKAPSRQTRRLTQRLAMLTIGIAIVSVGVGAVTITWPLTAITVAPPIATPLPRWHILAQLPAARSRLAVAVYENKIYAIGGETKVGVTQSVEAYDPATDTWAARNDKPTGVADAGAAIIGGRIYVPGGRLASGQLTGVLESYDPREDLWQQHAAMPTALSGQAVAAFEGRLYVFGGWDGQDYQAAVSEYDPSTDSWMPRTAMPTARGFAAVGVAGGRLYVMGGMDGEQVLSSNEEYVPEAEGSSREPWTSRAPLPSGRYALGATGIADTIHVFGGLGGLGQPQVPLIYFPQSDRWQEFESPAPKQVWSNLGLAALETHLYVIGGTVDGVPAAKNFSYQAIYTVLIPNVP